MFAMAPLHTMLFVSMEYSTATKAAKAQRSALDFPESCNSSKFDLGHLQKISALEFLLQEVFEI